MLLPSHASPAARRALLISILLVMGIGYMDLITGYQLSFFLFYAAPILWVVWRCDRNSAVLVALISAIVWWWADWKSGHPYLNDFGQIWETGMRVCFFLFVVIGGSAMKTKHDAVEAQLEALNRQRQLEVEIVSAAEREQLRIGQDLHDGLCQFLAGIGCATTSLKDDLYASFSPEAETAGEIEELIRDAVMQARNLARGIAPVHMDEVGLACALEELAANITRFSEIECIFAASGDSVQIAPEIATHLYRIAQEATNNAVKHAQAKRIEIDLRHTVERMELTVNDDGCGLLKRPERKGGMGLKTMQYRARLIGASLAVAGSGDEGTRVTCHLPLAVAGSSEELHEVA